MKIRGNIVKGWVTSVIGTLLLLSSLFLWFFGVINLIWEGAIGIILGVILLYAPRTVEKKLSEAIKAWGQRGGNEGRGGGWWYDNTSGNDNLPPYKPVDENTEGKTNNGPQ